MKTIIRLFAAVLTAVPVLVSCYSEPLPEIIPEVIPEDEDNGSEQEAGTRIITLSFDTKSTRTELGDDGITPKFKIGDKIAISSITNPTDTQHCKVSVDPSTGIATTVTKFDGVCKAVYPAKYAMINDNKLTFIVPSEQTGKFEDANICTADISAGENPTAEFKNQTAVFRIELENLYSYDEYPNYGIGVNDVTISSLGKIENGQRGTTLSPISSDTESENKITIPPGAKYYYCPLYISVLCDGKNSVLLADLNFDINYDFYADWDNDEPTTSPTSMGGFSPKFLTSKNKDPKTATVQAGAIYTGVEDHLHEYILTPRDAQKTGSTDMKWAIEDLSNGEYFMWGELSGHAWNGSWTGFTNDDGFSSSNYTNPQYTAITANGVLRLEDDAAYQNWGGAWRMPTSGEWDRINGSSGISTLVPHLSRSDYASGNSTSSSSFYYYWSSTLNSPMGGFNPIQVISYCYTINNEGFVTRINNDAQLITPSSGIGMCIKAASPAF